MARIEHGTELNVVGGLLPDRFVEDAMHQTSTADFPRAEVAIRGGQIHAVPIEHLESAPWRLDASGCVVLPGFIDVHTHGAMGHDTMDASVDALAAMARFYAGRGVTAFLPTTMTADHASTLNAVAAVAEFARCQSEADGARLLGVHLEGPYISPDFPGAQRADQVRPPDPAEFCELLDAGPVRLVTLAPEQPGARELVRLARARGIAVAAGHTAATYAQFEAGVEWGVTQATHTFNAMRGLHHREPGALGATLANDQVFAQLIADNIHVHPAAMQILWRCKGSERLLLITDAMRAAGLASGDYELGGQPVTVSDGRCCLEDGTLAGSVLAMDEALRNFIAATDASLAQVWPVTSLTPARALNMADQLGVIAPGYPADLVLLDGELQVVATVVQGRVVYLRDTERLANG